MAFNAIADNATGRFVAHANARGAGPAYDSATQTLVRLPRPPEIETERWDSAKGVDFSRDGSGEVIASTVPLRGLNSAEQLSAADARADSVTRSAIEHAAPLHNLATALADIGEVLHDVAGVQIANLSPEKRAKWQRAERVLAQIRTARG